jgi:hypothetical protein
MVTGRISRRRQDWLGKHKDSVKSRIAAAHGWGAGLCVAKRVPYAPAVHSLPALILPTEPHVEDAMALTLPAVVEQFTIPDTMRSAVLFGPRDIRVIERPVPQPGPGEVLVQVAMCGTCGTDPDVGTHFLK